MPGAKSWFRFAAYAAALFLIYLLFPVVAAAMLFKLAGTSLKYACCRHCTAVFLYSALYLNTWSRRSNASGDISYLFAEVNY